LVTGGGGNADLEQASLTEVVQRTTKRKGKVKGGNQMSAESHLEETDLVMGEGGTWCSRKEESRRGEVICNKP